ncbi:MAG: hypothetical protein AAFP69_09035 [Planctomycetota bacterium]
MSESNRILRVAKWSKTFQKSDHRKTQELKWVSMPNNFDSSGYQDLVDDFDPMQAAALYGAWVALVLVASKMPTPGLLVSSRGKAVTAARIARMSHLPADLFETLIQWATDPNIGWLEYVEDQEKPGDFDVPDGIRKPSGNAPDRHPDSAPTTEQDSTGHNKTIHNRSDSGLRTRARRPDAAAIRNESDQISLIDGELTDEAVQLAARAAAALRPRAGNDRQLIARAAILATHAWSPHWFTTSLRGVTETSTRRPMAKFRACLIERGQVLHERDFAELETTITVPQWFYKRIKSHLETPRELPRGSPIQSAPADDANPHTDAATNARRNDILRQLQDA